MIVDKEKVVPAEAGARVRTPFGVWVMAGIFGIGLIVLIIMSNIDF